MIPLTTHNAKLYTDKDTIHFQNVLFEELELNPYWVYIVFSKIKTGIKVAIKYKGEEFDPRNTVGMVFPENYLGGCGNEAITLDKDKISYKYENGFNIITIKFNAEVARKNNQVAKIAVLVENNSGELELVYRYYYVWNSFGLDATVVDENGLLYEIISNICRHSNIKEGKSFRVAKDSSWMIVRTDINTFKIVGSCTLETIVNIVDIINKETKLIMVNIILEDLRNVVVTDAELIELQSKYNIYFDIFEQPAS